MHAYYSYRLMRRQAFSIALLACLLPNCFLSGTAKTALKLGNDSTVQIGSYERALESGCKVTPGAKDVRDVLIELACTNELSGNTSKALQVLKRTLLLTRKHWPNDQVSIGRIQSILALIESLHGNTASAADYRKKTRAAYTGNFGLPETELTSSLSRLMFWGFFGPITYEEWTGNSEPLRELLSKRFAQLAQSASIDQAELDEIVPIAIAINISKFGEVNHQLPDNLNAVLAKVHSKGSLANEFFSALLLSQKGDLKLSQDMLETEANKITTQSAAKEHIDWSAIPDLAVSYQKANKKQLDSILAKAPDIFGSKDVCLMPVFVSEATLSEEQSKSRLGAFGKALAIASSWIDPNEDSIETARGLLLLAWLYDYTQQYDKATISLKRALPIYEKMFGTDSMQIAYVLESYGKQNAKLKNYTEADDAIDRAVAIAVKVTSHGSPLFVAPVTELPILSELASYYETRGQTDKAKQTLAQIQAIAKRNNATAVASSVAYIPYVGGLNIQKKTPEPTIAELERAANVADKTLDTSSTDSTNRANWTSAQSKLAYAYITAKEYAKANSLYQRIFQALDSWQGSNSKLSVAPLTGYIELLKLMGKNDEADKANARLVNIIDNPKR